MALSPVSSAEKYIQSGDLRALAVSGDVSVLEGVPTFADLGYAELTPLNVQRLIAGPPDMEPELLQMLREAFAGAIADPKFRQAALTAGLTLSFLAGEDAATEVATSFSFYESFSANLKNPNAL